MPWAIYNVPDELPTDLERTGEAAVAILTDGEILAASASLLNFALVDDPNSVIIDNDNGMSIVVKSSPCACAWKKIQACLEIQ